MNKQTIDVDELNNNSEQMNISEACLEFMKVEFGVEKDKLEKKLNKHPQQRLQSGKSLIIKVTGVDRDMDEGEATITGKIDYSKFPYDNPGEILAGLRLKDGSNGSTGSFVNAIELKRNLEQKENVSVSDLSDCPSLVVEEINIDEPEQGKKPTTGEVELSRRLNHSSKTEFKLREKPVTKNRKNDDYAISVGDIYLLESRLTDWTFDSAHYALQNPEYSDMHSLIEKMIHDYGDNKTELFNKDVIREFVQWMKQNDSNVLPVNEKQKDFIVDCDSEVSLLQGPPGTGKTSGAIAPGIISRLLGKDDGKPCRVLVTGASNKSINEVMKETVELASKYQKDSSTGDELEDTEFARLVEPAENEDDVIIDTTDKPFTVRRTALYNNHAGDVHGPVISDRVKNVDVNDESKHVVVFATARRAWRLAKQEETIPNFALKNSETTSTGVVSGDRPRRGEAKAYGLFDVLVADEASMMKMPEFLLTGTFYDSGGNVMIAGDHRQLPPVEKHDWKNDYRPSVTENAPYVSVLDFFRLMKGENIDLIDDEMYELLRINDNDVTIPLHQLKRTYRCHSRVADFLQKWVYKKLDGIKYESNITKTMDNINVENETAEKILRPQSPVTVVTYDEQTNQQSNELEAELVRTILKNISDSYSTGVVTPHNAQRGLIETKIELDNNLSQTTDVDTVERFQGGERDVIIVSGTVSDPDYVEKEEEFLLNLNRLNVAMSRMKKKLIVIASKSVFNHVPIETEKYENALLWKGLAKESGMINNKGITINPEELIRKTEYLNDYEKNTTFSIHHFNKD